MARKKKSFDIDKIDKVLTHTQDPPKDVVDFINRYGGVDLFGQPNFRLMWGGVKQTVQNKANRWTMEALAKFDGTDRGSYRFIGTYTDVDGESYIAPDIGYSKFLIDLARKLRETSRAEFEAMQIDPESTEEHYKDVIDMYLRVKDRTPRSLWNPTIYQPGSVKKSSNKENLP